MNRIAELREARKWKQEDLARRLHVTPQSVGRYEREDQKLTLPLLRQLANIFGTKIGVIAGEEPLTGGQIAIPVHSPAGDVHGMSEDARSGFLMFPERWLSEFVINPRTLSVVEIDGDYMSETLRHGDHVLIDHSQTDLRHEGLYAIEIAGATRIRRLVMHPVTRLISIQADNLAYQQVHDVKPQDIKVVGRVIWIGHVIA